jgi:hypothetical protein
MEKTIKAIANYKVLNEIYPQRELNFIDIALAIIDDITSADKLNSVDHLFIDCIAKDIKELKSQI